MPYHLQHFLIGWPITALPEPKTTRKETISLTLQNNRMEILIRYFWKKWSTEYLSNLQQRKKWQMGQTNIDTNDVVKINEEAPPTLWQMGRITKVFDGNDKIVWVVELKAPSGLFKQPVNKLLLSMKDDMDMLSLWSDREEDTDYEWTKEDTDDDWQQEIVKYYCTKGDNKDWLPF